MIIPLRRVSLRFIISYLHKNKVEGTKINPVDYYTQYIYTHKCKSCSFCSVSANTKQAMLTTSLAWIKIFSFDIKQPLIEGGIIWYKTTFDRSWYHLI